MKRTATEPRPEPRNGKPHNDLPSANIEAEEGLLTNCIALPTAMDYEDIASLPPGDISDQNFRVIFRHIIDAHRDGQKPETLPARLVAAGEVDAAGGRKVYRKLFEIAKTISGSDARYYAEEVRKAAYRRRLWEIGQEYQQQLADQSIPPADIRAFLESAIDAIHARNRSDDVDLLTAADLAAGHFATDYHVSGILVKGQPFVAAAPQKALKTSIVCMDMGLSLASGTAFLGHWPTNQCPVLVLSGESGLGALQQTAQRICSSKGIALASVEGFHLSTWIPRFDNHKELTKLRRLLERTKAGVAFLDPVYLCMPGDDAGNVFAMGESLRGVSQVGADTGTTIGLIHHMRKSLPEPYGMPELSWIGWSGFGEYARQWLLLNRRQQYEPGSGEHALWMTVGGSAGHGGAWGVDVSESVVTAIGGRIWETQIKPAGEVSREASKARLLAKFDKQEEAKAVRLDMLKDKIAEALQANGGPMTRNKLREQAKVSGKTINEAIDEMIEAGTVCPRSVTTNGGNFEGVELKVGQARTRSDN